MDAKATVQRLLALATNHGASVEEQRTAAMAAARLIQEHSLLVDANDNPFAGARPLEHCPSCRCYSNEDVGRYEPGHPSDPTTSWRVDFEDNPKSEEDRKYSEGWDRIWGGGG